MAGLRQDCRPHNHPARARQHNWPPRETSQSDRATRSGRAGRIVKRFAPTNAPAIPPKPKTPAISAMMRNVTTQLSMTRTSVYTFCFEYSAAIHRIPGNLLERPDREGAQARVLDPRPEGRNGAIAMRSDSVAELDALARASRRGGLQKLMEIV